ncbi:sigma-54-dependent Fis family transcriptional regulator [Tepidanaerobacter syntrophicus]|nr:sigma-54-dependent Fis family transcriptional regulator [Tepidanaerobacter syntrophicus]
MRPILFIAPFKKIAKTAIKVSQEMNINLIVETGNMETALAIMRKYPDADVVISRGGTAELLKNLEDISVVEIRLSINDFMNAISSIAKKNVRKIGVVTRKSIFEESITDYNFFDTTVYFRPCKDVDQIKSAIEELNSQGIEAIIGDKMAIEFAKKHNMVTKLLDSGEIAIKMALEEALSIVHAKEQERLRAAQVNAIINNIEEGIIATTSDGRISFYNDVAKKMFTDKSNNINFERVYSFLKSKDKEKILDTNNDKIFARTIPLYAQENYKGSILTFQEVKNIQASERKIRLSLYEKGFYAKKTFDDIIGESENIKAVIEKAEKYASTNSNILIYGETGTGKEIFAQSIHNYSNRSKGPFVSVNCASLPSNLIESELFGYVEGAFTGARRGGKIGLIELAHGGTIFLDEIAELPLDIQSRLLRVIQEKEIMRIGDDKIIPVDVRIVCATNKDLLTMVHKRTFREDLYYRINVLKLNIPPLRERKSDIIKILDYYLGKFNAQYDKKIILKDDAKDALLKYEWPGNIRELKNLAEKVIALSDRNEVVNLPTILSLLREESYCGYAYNDENHIQIKESDNLKEMEQQILKQLEKRYGADEVCRRLNISKVTLWRKMNMYFKNEINEIQN